MSDLDQVERQEQRRCVCGQVATRRCDATVGPGVSCNRLLCALCTSDPCDGLICRGGGVFVGKGQPDRCPEHDAEHRAREADVQAGRDELVAAKRRGEEAWLLCPCGNNATLLCDWWVTEARQCSAPMCPGCVGDHVGGRMCSRGRRGRGCEPLSWDLCAEHAEANQDPQARMEQLARTVGAVDRARRPSSTGRRKPAKPHAAQQALPLGPVRAPPRLDEEATAPADPVVERFAVKVDTGTAARPCCAVLGTWPMSW